MVMMVVVVLLFLLLLFHVVFSHMFKLTFITHRKKQLCRWILCVLSLSIWLLLVRLFVRFCLYIFFIYNFMCSNRVPHTHSMWRVCTKPNMILSTLFVSVERLYYILYELYDGCIEYTAVLCQICIRMYTYVEYIDALTNITLRFGMLCRLLSLSLSLFPPFPIPLATMLLFTIIVEWAGTANLLCVNDIQQAMRHSYVRSPCIIWFKWMK